MNDIINTILKIIEMRNFLIDLVFISDQIYVVKEIDLQNTSELKILTRTTARMIMQSMRANPQLEAVNTSGSHIINDFLVSST